MPVCEHSVQLMELSNSAHVECRRAGRANGQVYFGAQLSSPLIKNHRPQRFAPKHHRKASRAAVSLTKILPECVIHCPEASAHPYPHCKLAPPSIVHELAHKLVRWFLNGRQSPLRHSLNGPKLLNRAAVDALNGPANPWPVVRALVGAAQLR